MSPLDLKRRIQGSCGCKSSTCQYGACTRAVAHATRACSLMGCGVLALSLCARTGVAQLGAHTLVLAGCGARQRGGCCKACCWRCRPGHRIIKEGIALCARQPPLNASSLHASLISEQLLKYGHTQNHCVGKNINHLSFLLDHSLTVETSPGTCVKKLDRSPPPAATQSGSHLCHRLTGLNMMEVPAAPVD